jgi:hypothetical protein
MKYGPNWRSYSGKRMIMKNACQRMPRKILIENPPKEQISRLPPKAYFRDNTSSHLDHRISYMIYELDLKVHENACADPEPRPKWAQSILPAVCDLESDLF